MRRLVHRTPLLAMGIALAACGGPGAAQDASSAGGVTVSVQTTAPFASAPDFAVRLDDTIDVALAYWGGTRQDLAGKTIELVDEQNPHVCSNAGALGCYDGRTLAVTTRDPSTGTFLCVEQTALVHEIGHLVIGDPDHTDPRWMEMDTIAQALSGRTGYTASGTAPCDMYVSVWRHPLGTP
jgi:hypothetical protein